MPPENLEKLKKKLQAIDEAITMQDLEKAIEAVLSFSKKLENRTEKTLEDIAEAVQVAITRIEATADGAHKNTTTKLQEKVEAVINEINFAKEAFLAEAQAKIDDIRDGDDGKDADEDEIIERLLPMVVAKVPPPVIPDTSEDLEILEEEIKKLNERISNIRTAPFIGPSRGIFLKVNGVKQGIVNELNIVGSGVSITKVNGLPTVTITGGSGATAVETPTGTVNGTNTTFTVSNTPLYIIVDGISKFVTTHYTYSGGTIEITDGAPPTQYIRSIYSA